MNDNVTRCAHCGQAILPKANWPRLTKHERQVYDAVAGRPRSVEALRTILWGHDPNGGPSNRALYVTINQLNAKLLPYGVKIKFDRDVNLYGFVEVRDGSRPGDADRGSDRPGAGVQRGGHPGLPSRHSGR